MTATQLIATSQSKTSATPRYHLKTMTDHKALSFDTLTRLAIEAGLMEPRDTMSNLPAEYAGSICIFAELVAAEVRKKDADKLAKLEAQLAAIGAGGVSGPLLGGTLRTQAQPVGDERGAFEAWARGQTWIKDCGKHPADMGTYGHWDTQKVWQAWQTRAAIAAQAPQQAAPAAEWLEQAYREGWAACRDAETIGQEAEDWAFGNSTANSRMIDMQQAAPQHEVQEPWGYARRMKSSGWGLCCKREYAEAATDGDDAVKLYTAQPAPSGDAKDAARYRAIRDCSMDDRNRLEHYSGPALDVAIDTFNAARATSHVQNPAGNEHIAGDVSKSGQESNMSDAEDTALLDWLDQNIFHREMDEWDAKYGGRGDQNMWVLFAPKGVQGSARNIINAARKKATQ